MTASIRVQSRVHLHGIPREAALRAALESPACFAEDGRALSWVSSLSDGYPYDEATALFGRYHRWSGNFEGVESCRKVLEQRIITSGLLGRDGIGYAFDSALALPLLASPEALSTRVLKLLQTERSCTEVRRPGWWSESFGPHLIRSLAALAAQGFGTASEEIAQHLVRTCFDGNRFRIHEDSPATYVHAHCYALEGLLSLGIRGDVVLAGAEWLARLQSQDGALPNWVGAPADVEPTDAVAQALRIWSTFDSSAFVEPMHRARSFLAARQERDGVLTYSRQSSDRCSWANLFAAQAIRWSESGVDSAALKLLI